MYNFKNKIKYRIRKKENINNKTESILCNDIKGKIDNDNNVNGSKPLLTKKERFCQEYLIDLNILKAGKRSGYISDNHMYKLINEKSIQDRISYLTWQRSKRLEINQDSILKELSKIAFFNLQDAYDDQGNLKDINHMSRDTTSAIQSIDTIIQKNRQGKEIGILKKIKTEGKLIALEKLGKHIGLFLDDNKIDPMQYARQERKTNLEKLSTEEIIQYARLTKKALISDSDSDSIH